MGTYDKYLGSNSKVGKIAQKVSDIAGGKGITDYAGGRGTKMGALKSAGVVLSSVVPAGVALKVVQGARAASGINRVSNVAQKIPKTIKVVGQKKPMKVIDGWTTKKKGHELTKPPRGSKW